MVRDERERCTSSRKRLSQLRTVEVRVRWGYGHARFEPMTNAWRIQIGEIATVL